MLKYIDYVTEWSFHKTNLFQYPLLKIVLTQNNRILKFHVYYDSLGGQNRKHEYIIKGDLFSGLKAMAPLVQ